MWIKVEKTESVDINFSNVKKPRIGFNSWTDEIGDKRKWRDVAVVNFFES